MKIIAVRNAHTNAEFHPTVHVGYDPVTSELSVSFQLPAPTDETTAGNPGVTLIDSVVVNLNVLRARYDWCDHQVYFVAATKSLPIFALYPETLTSRESAQDYARRLRRNLLVGINVPLASSSNDELFVTVNLNELATDANIQVNEHCSLTWSDANSSGAVRALLLPHIQAAAPATMTADSSTTIELRVEDATGNLIQHPATVYVETVSGVVPFARVAVTGGLAVVPVSAAGLSAGDKVRVKFGWKYFPGADEVLIAVV